MLLLSSCAYKQLACCAAECQRPTIAAGVHLPAPRHAQGLFQSLASSICMRPTPCASCCITTQPSATSAPLVSAASVLNRLGGLCPHLRPHRHHPACARWLQQTRKRAAITASFGCSQEVARRVSGVVVHCLHTAWTVPAQSTAVMNADLARSVMPGMHAGNPNSVRNKLEVWHTCIHYGIPTPLRDISLRQHQQRIPNLVPARIS